MKKQCERATKIPLLPKAGWADLGRGFVVQPNPIMQKLSICLSFVVYPIEVLRSNDLYYESLRGPRTDP